LSPPAPPEAPAPPPSLLMAVLAPPQLAKTSMTKAHPNDASNAFELMAALLSD
jgi:hypothetical protein